MRWWGNRAHRIYTVVVLVILAALDNTALQLLPPLFGVVSEDLEVTEAALGFVTATTLLLTAITAALWGYVGDRLPRRPLLVGGTLVWAAGTALAGIAPSTEAGGFTPGLGILLTSHVIIGVGTGAVASIGFAVISDLIPPRHRGIAMSFWGLSQGVGALAGTLVAGTLGATDWRVPFFGLSLVGVGIAVAYSLGYDTPRGASEPELRELHEQGDPYPYRIEPDDLPVLARRRTNIWLVLQGLTAQFAYGSLIWLPRLFQSRIAAGGASPRLSVIAGSVLAGVFQLGGVMSILGGWLGDRWQQRTLRARPAVSAIGILGAIPFFLVLFFLPLNVEVEDGSTGEVVLATLKSVVTNPSVGAAFLIALLALTFTSADSPNWFALIGDVNLPEHRGTVFGVGNLVNGVGRAAGNGLVGLVFGLEMLDRFPPDVRFAIGLAAFQVFFLPTGWMYWRASRTAPGDITEVRERLAARGEPRAG
ncbi:MAG: MFS transporter [Nitriliruptorales bacterium]